MAATAIEEAFEDIFARFVAPLPDEERESQERVMITLQDAYWYYADFFVDEAGGACPPLGFGQFVERFLHHTPALVKEKVTVKTLLSHFHKYLRDIPVCGAVLLSPNMDSCLLVQGFESGAWGFPKGKVDHGESEVDCAIREVHEEIGYDVSHALDPNRWIETSGRGGRRVRLYIILDVDPAQAHFQTRTRKEISAIQWWPLKQLPKLAKSMQGAPRALRDWIHRHTHLRPHVSIAASAIPALPVPVSVPASPATPAKERKAHGKGGKGKGCKAASLPTSPAAAAKKGGPHGNGGGEYRDTRSYRDWDAKLAETFGEDALVAVAPAPAGRKEGGCKGRRKGSPPSAAPATGWSAEEMFRLNEERYGVKTTVPPSDLVYPPNADEIIARVLGPGAVFGAGGRSRSAGKRFQHKHSHQHYHHHQQQQPRGVCLAVPPPLEGKRAVSAPSPSASPPASSADSSSNGVYSVDELTKMLQAAIGVAPSAASSAVSVPAPAPSPPGGPAIPASAPAPASQPKQKRGARQRKQLLQQQQQQQQAKSPAAVAAAPPVPQQQQQPVRILKRGASVPFPLPSQQGQYQQQQQRQQLPAVVRTGTQPSFDDFRFDASSILTSLEAALAAS